MLFTADGNNDPSWFSPFENDDYFIAFCSSKKGDQQSHRVLPLALLKIDGLFLATILKPIAKLLSKYHVDTCG
jgi:hypothetical protein